MIFNENHFWCCFDELNISLIKIGWVREESIEFLISRLSWTRIKLIFLSVQCWTYVLYQNLKMLFFSFNFSRIKIK
jgi:hypothetical protein